MVCEIDGYVKTRKVGSDGELDSSASHLRLVDLADYGTQDVESTASAPRRRANARAQAAKRKARFIETIAFFVAVVAGVGATGFGVVQFLAEPSAVHANVVAITVAPGDTLWSLAHQGAISTGESTSAEVAQIRSLNQSISGDAPLKVGQKILIPSVNSGGGTVEVASR